MLRLHLIDGTYELFRAYYAMPSERAPDGQEVGAVRGLIGTLLSLLDRGEVTHIAAATDQVIESFRNDLFDGYKTGAGVPDDLKAQFPLAEEAMRVLGIVVWPMIELEADDALASAATRFAGEVDQVVILSPDKDLFQCVRGTQVVVYDRRREKTYDAAAVKAKFGVEPESIPDLLALVGDSADGIPGVPGWGMKTAAKVLSGYRSIEKIPDDPRRWRCRVGPVARLAAALAEHRAEAMLYKRLTTLRVDAPIRETLSDLQWQGVNRRDYEAFCRRCGFGQLARRPRRWA